jgi:hypothetical protein
MTPCSIPGASPAPDAAHAIVTAAVTVFGKSM